MKFLSYDSKFSQWMIRFCYCCWLNLLWFFCSIPIVTLGASTTALYYVTLKLARDEDGNVTSMFFRACSKSCVMNVFGCLSSRKGTAIFPLIPCVPFAKYSCSGVKQIVRWVPSI